MVEPGFSNGNSFIIDSTLITSNIIHHKLYLAFYDLATGKLIKYYDAPVRDSVSFLHSRVMKTGNFWTKNNVHATSLGDMIQRSFDFWVLGVNAYKCGKGKIEIEIATIYDRATFAEFMTTLVLTGAGAYAVIAVPGISSLTVFAIDGGGKKNTIFLNSQFSLEQFEQGPYTELPDKEQLVNNFMYEQGITLKTASVISEKGYRYLGYLDPVNFKYFIYKF